MRFPNGFFGNGPGNGDDTQSQRDLEAYNRSRLQMTVATSTFAGIALVGMFCSCLWFVCCRNSSSKTRKGRTWASANAEMGNHANPYSYDGYLDSQGYLQTNGGGEGYGDSGVAPYISNPLYHPNNLYPSDTGIPSAYDFNEYGFNHTDKSQMISLTEEGNFKDVPPSYTALFFASNEQHAGIGGNKGVVGAKNEMNQSSRMIAAPPVTTIQPIHLKVSSTTQDEFSKMDQPQEKKVDLDDWDNDDDESYMENLGKKDDPSMAPPVSLLSVESDPGKESEMTKGSNTAEDTNKNILECDERADRGKNPPPYNPGYNHGYRRF